MEEEQLIKKPNEHDSVEEEALIDAKIANVVESGVITVDSLAALHPVKLPPECEKGDTGFLSTAFGSVTTIKSIDHKKSINARTVLWYLSFFGFATNYMLRVTINIGITEMNAMEKNVSNNHVAECVALDMSRHNFTDSSMVASGALSSPRITKDMVSALVSSMAIEQRFLDALGVSEDDISCFWFWWFTHSPTTD